MNQKVVKASLFKRIGAAALDFALAIATSFILLSFVATPIANGAAGYSEKTIEYYDMQVEAGLFVYAKQEGSGSDYKVNIVVDFNNFSELEAIKEEVAGDANYAYCALTQTSLVFKDDMTMDTYLTHFYTEIDNLDAYKGYKLAREDLYDNVDGEPMLKVDSDSEELDVFYRSIYGSALNDEKVNDYKDGKFMEVYQSLVLIQNVMIFASIIIGFALLYLLVPMITKYRVTLGKKVMSLAVVDMKNGYIASRPSVLIRFLTFLIIEVYASILLYGVPLLVSLVMMCFTKNNSAIHDILARDLVVDATYQKIYKNEEEYKQDEALEKKTDYIDTSVTDSAEPLSRAQERSAMDVLAPVKEEEKEEPSVSKEPEKVEEPSVTEETQEKIDNKPEEEK